jgi:hypothetical protein
MLMANDLYLACLVKDFALKNVYNSIKVKHLKKVQNFGVNAVNLVGIMVRHIRKVNMDGIKEFTAGVVGN